MSITENNIATESNLKLLAENLLDTLLMVSTVISQRLFRQLLAYKTWFALDSFTKDQMLNYGFRFRTKLDEAYQQKFL